MNAESPLQIDDRTRSALDELRVLIQWSYPDATFTVSEGDDPPGFYLKTIVDVEDIEEIVDVFMDRLLEMQVDENLPVYVIPLEPIERVLENMRANALPRKYEFLGTPH